MRTLTHWRWGSQIRTWKKLPATYVKKISLVKGHTLALRILQGSLLIHRGNRGLLKMLEYLLGVPMLPYTKYKHKSASKIWMERNYCVFEGASPDIQELLQSVGGECSLWCMAGACLITSLLVGWLCFPFLVIGIVCLMCLFGTSSLGSF